jgi:CBS-domain-containing membrane protein
MKIREVMTRDVCTLDPWAPLSEAARLMWEHDCGLIPVVDPHTQALVGVITDRDACMAAFLHGQALHSLPIEAAMARTLVTCRPEDDAAAALEALRRHQLHRLPVVDAQGLLAGIVTINDLAREASRQRGSGRQQLGSEVTETVAAICRPREAVATAEA